MNAQHVIFETYFAKRLWLGFSLCRSPLHA